MRPALEDIELIEQYLAGELDAATIREVELRMRKDPLFKEGVEAQRFLLQGLEQHVWRVELNEIHNQQLNAEGSYDLLKGLFLLLSIAAGIAWLLTSGSQLFVNRIAGDSLSVASQVEAITVVPEALIGSREMTLLKSDSVFWRPELKQRPSVVLPTLLPAHKAEEEDQPRIHHYPTSDEYPEEYFTQWFKVRRFDATTSPRMIIFPVTTLDYDFRYLKDADALMDAKLNLLAEEKYDKTFIATREFRLRVEGCIVYHQNADLINLYLKHISLPLWKVDSMAADLLQQRIIVDCNRREFLIKGYEYFSWLKSLHQEELFYTDCVQRNYRKGGVYKVVEEERMERYFISCGLSVEEAEGVFSYFKEWNEMRNRFRTELLRLNSLEYNYDKLGVYTEFELPACR